jgi:hypothetical protein
MKIMAGELHLPLWKRPTSFLSVVPTVEVYNSAAETAKNVVPDTEAIALTNEVLAQPGGPYSRTPKTI